MRLLESKYYCLSFSNSNLRDRLEGNKKAEGLKKKALRKANFIGQFPFVRSVSISGSMSKGYMGDDADLDFFIITKPGRLWVSRTLLIFFKKVFLLNSRKYFCINYLVDTDHMEIEEKNRFTATELVTLISVYGNGQFDDFCDANSWAFKHFPNAQNHRWDGKSHNGAMKRTLEKLLQGNFGASMDRYFMKITLKRWNRKFGTMNEQQFDVAFKTRTYVSKHHPGNFQQRVLEKSNEIKGRIKQEFDLEWND